MFFPTLEVKLYWNASAFLDEVFEPIEISTLNFHEWHKCAFLSNRTQEKLARTPPH
jgi:hypothetical protein